MHGKTCLVTGATSGIGKATALALAGLGATVVLVCRDGSKGREVTRQMRAATGNGSINALVADLSLQWQVRRLAAAFSREHERLDVLVNNAGAMFPHRVETDEGIEITLSVNHLAPFLLTNLLLKKLKAASEARVINVNSDAHEKAIIDFDDIHMRRHYPSGGVGMRAYGNAKLPLDRASGPVRLLKPFWHIAKHAILTAEQGAATPVYLASSLEVRDVSGLYFEKCVPVASSAASRDRNLQRRMWGISEQLTGS
jgi:NAD(P)-dependent dehydrogenase (short-subunit alcohol dehydrogenase family)